MELFFPKEINRNQSSFLLAVSGGVDSMVLLELFRREKLKFSVAHMNFNLRDEEADKDQELVEITCNTFGIQIFTKSVDTKKYKAEIGVSTQMAARDLRYEWLYQLCEENGFDYLVTAHHADDQAETFFINLLRKSGTKGLTGMQILNHQLFRPLLNHSKQDIYDFANENNIKWREDASNQSNDYLRNSIRNKIIPLFKEVDPHFIKSISQTTKILQEENHWIENQIENLKEKFLKPLKNNSYSIKISELKKHLPLNTTIHYLFSVYGFNSPQEIIKLMQGKNSAEIKSISHRLIKNRDELLLSPLNKETANRFEINLEEQYFSPIKIFLTKSLSADNQANASFDFKSINFPLSLRHQKNGDRFYPSGMKGKSKKLSKYFKDNKFSKLEKEQTFLLVDAHDEIIWVVGHRQDERFLPNMKTKIWLHAEL